MDLFLNIAEEKLLIQMLSQQASDIIVMEEGKAVAHGTHLLPPHHRRCAQLNSLSKTGPLSQLKSQPGFVASLLDRIEQNQGAAAAGQSRGPGTLSFASVMFLFIIFIITAFPAMAVTFVCSCFR